ncbi:LD-carboxypeptidase [Verrucomicrobia bacterium]|nr:LD-carboxypeptidase [Verrucomicrobiota bacterium]
MRKLKLFKETSFGGLGKTVNLWLATLLLGAILFTGCATSGLKSRKAMQTLNPRALAPGDTIGFISPSSPIERVKMERAIQIIEKRGYRTKLPEGLYDADGYLAGSDRLRARQFMEVLTDPEVDVVFAAAGGYGAMRMLPHVDFSRLDQPKIVAGFSDITAIHLALWSQCGWTSFHGPNMMDGFGQGPGHRSATRSWFWQILEGDGVDVILGNVSEPGERADSPHPRKLVSGKVRGRLVGGNLSLISALVGTPYELDTRDAILFLEDVGERPYRIDRMLSQMQLAGQLDHLAGVLLGQFTNCEPRDEKATWDVMRVLNHYFGNLEVPVLMNFPAGHHAFNSTIPLGYQVARNKAFLAI